MALALRRQDFFWDAEDHTVRVYENICQYLELSFRVEVLNRRLDMMRDMLGVVQAQHQSQYMTKLDWIIIWLLVLEVVVQVCGGGVMMLFKMQEEQVERAALNG